MFLLFACQCVQQGPGCKSTTLQQDTSPMKLEEDRKLWPGFLDTLPKPWLGLAGLGHTEGEQSWQSHVFACSVPQQESLILTQLEAGLQLLPGTGMLPGHAKPGAGQSVFAVFEG